MPFAVSPRQAAASASRARAHAHVVSNSAPVAAPRAQQPQHQHKKIQIVAHPSDVESQSQPHMRVLAAFFAAIAVSSSSSVISSPAAALGLESVPIPALEAAVARSSEASSTSSSTSSTTSAPPLSRQAAAIADADAAFSSSELLRTLKERTSANAARNKQAIADKYCLRQAEMGVGDCSGLRLIPGATKSGKQKTPKLLGKLLGKEEAIEEYQNSSENEAAIAAVEKMRKSAAQLEEE